MTEDDGVSLQSMPHPVEITDDMVAAGIGAALESRWRPPTTAETQTTAKALVCTVFEAMVHAAPPEPELNEELNEDALEEALVTIQVANSALDEMAEEIAIYCAPGNDGDTWEPHYTEEQKNHWRRWARDLVMTVGQWLEDGGFAR